MEHKLETVIEAILFWRGEPVTLPELCRTLRAPSSDIKKAVQTLKEQLSERGIALLQTEDTFALATAPEAHELIERLRKEELSRDLGRAALETLSIVLYKGTVSRRDIEYIRGVNSTTILRSLLIRGLIERKQNESDDLPTPDRAPVCRVGTGRLHAAGRGTQVGRMFLYRPTVELLSLLGIANADELPEFANVRSEFNAVDDEEEKSESALVEDGHTETAHE